MRVFVVAVVVLLGCAPAPCSSDSCSGCCDSEGTCQSGASDSFCGSNGVACARCIGKRCVSGGLCALAPAGGGGGSSVRGGGGGSSFGGGSGGGSSSSGGGSGATPSVFVSLRFDWAQCCTSACDCQGCIQQTCAVTKRVPLDHFQSLRTSSLSACLAVQTASDGFAVDCTGNCTSTQSACRVNGTLYTDTITTCRRVAGTTDVPCDWVP